VLIITARDTLVFVKVRYQLLLFDVIERKKRRSDEL